MSAFHDNALMGASGSQGYTISRSVRLRSSASAYFNRTFGTPTNNTKFYLSVCLKRGSLGSAQTIISSYAGDANNFSQIYFDSSDRLVMSSASGGVTGANATTSAVFRDPSSWYLFEFLWDGSLGTVADRTQIWVNGIRQTVTGSNGSATVWHGNTAVSNRIGLTPSGGNQADFYLANIFAADGQSLTLPLCGATNSVTGVWTPKAYTSAYGNNGFYINFSDNSSNTATTIGKDYSGNGNNWTPNNISVTSGTTYDSMLDVPTPYVDGGNGRGNYAVLNPIDATGNATLSAANLRGTTVGVNGKKGSIAVSSGKWYWEATCVSGDYASVGCRFGIDSVVTPVASGSRPGSTSTSYVYTSWNGSKVNNNTSTSYGSTYTTNDVISVALDLDNGKIWWAKNGTWQASGDPAAGTNAAFTGVSGTYTSIFGDDTGGGIVLDFNFGQRPFAYTPPSGFNALNTFNLPEPTIKKGNAHMDVALFTGTSSNVTISGIGFQPDFVWAKARSNAQGHSNVDSVRGANKLLQTNLSNAESTLTNPPTFNSDGWTSTTDIHTNGYTYASWLWKAGGTSSSNTNGSITSTVSVNPTAGFSVVTFTQPASGSFTVGHGLGVAPKMIIGKDRTNGSTNWVVYHSALSSPQSNYLTLNTTNAVTSSTNIWNNANPTSTVVSSISGYIANASANTVLYCFAEVAGYSKFGSYTGNGSTDGPFVNLGFRPAFIMIKRTDTTGNWTIHDNKRLGYNGSSASKELYPNLSNAEGSDSMDQLSNGFKLRDTYSDVNASGGTYIYAAFAENPFKNALAR